VTTRLLALAFGTLLAGVLAGCGSKVQPVVSPPVKSGTSGRPDEPAASQSTAAVPGSAQQSTSATSVQGLPADKLPKPGPDGGIERDEATEWLAKNTVGKSIEFSLRVQSVEAEADGEGKYYADPDFLTNRESGETQKLSTNVKVSRINVKGVPCDVLVYGPSPLWSDLDATTAKKRRDELKGKLVHFKARVDEARFDPGEDDKHLMMIIGLSNVVVSSFEKANDPKRGDDFVKKDKPKPRDNPDTPPPMTTEAPADVVTKAFQTLNSVPRPKPKHVRDLPPHKIHPGELSQRIIEADDLFPRRKEIVGLLDGKPHGELRAYAPNKQLILVTQYDHGTPIGQQHTFHPNGSQLRQLSYANGQLDGECYDWYPNGQVANVNPMQNGKPDGAFASFFEDGKPVNVREHVEGRGHGQHSVFHDGKLTGVETYVNGQVVDVKTWEPVGIDVRLALQFRERRATQSFHAKDWWPDAATQQAPRSSLEVGKWHPLFNGKDLNGWWPSKMNTRYRDSWFKWDVVNGIITGTGQRQTGWLITEDLYRNFHLRVEARIDAKENSGVAFGIQFLHQFDYNLDKGWGAEIALADPPRTEASRAFPEPSVRTGGIMPVWPDVRNTNQIHHKPNEWFTMEIVVRGQNIIVSVNGKPTGEATITNTTRPVEAGHIGLQLHYSSKKVEFRKVEIMPLAD
jgi:hypothetical protein